MIHVLYIDDELDLCEIFQDIFESPDVRVTALSDVDLVWDLMQKDPPQLIFVDFRMPKMTGDELASRLPPSIPKILVTGEMDAQVKASFAAILPKPFDLPLMEQWIKNIAAV